MDLHLRLENHWLACMASVGGGARVTRMAGGLVVVNPRVAGYAFNFMTLRGVQPDRLAAAVEVGGALLAGGERPPAIFLSPAAGEAERLAAVLSDLGWRRLIRQSVLVRALPGPPEQDLPSGLTVEAVTPGTAKLWGRTMVAAYEVDPITGAALRKAWGAMLRAPGDTWQARGYLARLDGIPAGTGLLWSQGEIAGLYCGTVRPALRRQGIHRAMVLRRLADAAARGCLWAALQTEADSPVERLCAGSLGFSVAYYRELWAPAATGAPWSL